MSKVLYCQSKRSDSKIESRVVPFVLSTDREDRGGDTIDQSGWRLDRYKANPVVLWGHNQSLPPIGRCSNPRVSGRSLIGDVEFATAEQNPFAETVFQLVKGGFVNAGSVGFIPMKYEINRETGGLDFKEQELIEFSICGVPMNPDALAQARSLGFDGDAIERAFGEACPVMPLATKAAEFRAELLASVKPGEVNPSTLMRKSRAYQIANNYYSLSGR